MRATRKLQLPSLFRLASVAALALGLASLSIGEALSGIAQSHDPRRALPFAPWVGVAPALDADQSLVQSSSSLSDAEVSRMAQSSLISQALNPRAIRLLGSLADRAKRPDAALSLMLLSAKVSRRDLLTQIWQINRAAQAGDIAGALDHYDIALRTTKDAPQIIFPVLAQAIGTADIRQVFGKFVRGNAPWMPAFLDYGATQAAHPEYFSAALMVAGDISKDALYNGKGAALVSRLIAVNQFDAARTAFLGLHLGDPNLLTSAAFLLPNPSGDVNAMGWQLASAPTINAAISRVDNGREPSLSVYVASGERAVVGRKILYLSPGNYALAVTYGAAKLSREGDVLWQLQCQKGTTVTQFWQAQAIPSGSDGVQAVAAVAIPAQCDVEYLNLTVAGGAEQQGSELTVKRVALTKR